MKLSLCINVPEDSSGANDSDSSTIPDNPAAQQISVLRVISESEKIARVLEDYLVSLYPPAKLCETAEMENRPGGAGAVL